MAGTNPAQDVGVAAAATQGTAGALKPSLRRSCQQLNTHHISWPDGLAGKCIETHNHASISTPGP